jgi:putative flippase GtrA
MFECGLMCPVEDLSIAELAIVFAASAALLGSIFWYRKWAFSYEKHPDSSWRWHLPRLAFVIAAVAAITLPLVWAVFGYLGARLYSGTAFPFVTIVLYMAWLYSTDHTSNDQH